MHLIEEGEVMHTAAVDNWFDCGRKETLLEANARLLDRPEFREVRAYPELPEHGHHSAGQHRGRLPHRARHHRPQRGHRRHAPLSATPSLATASSALIPN
ncbi:MAG: hypothetical protein WKG07_12550 [Hymenobacter sp.]